MKIIIGLFLIAIFGCAGRGDLLDTYARTGGNPDSKAPTVSLEDCREMIERDIFSIEIWESCSPDMYADPNEPDRYGVPDSKYEYKRTPPILPDRNTYWGLEYEAEGVYSPYQSLRY